MFFIWAALIILEKLGLGLPGDVIEVCGCCTALKHCWWRGTDYQQSCSARIMDLPTTPKQSKKWICTHTDGFCWHNRLSHEMQPWSRVSIRECFPVWGRGDETQSQGVTHPNSDSKAETWAELDRVLSSLISQCSCRQTALPLNCVFRSIITCLLAG